MSTTMCKSICQNSATDNQWTEKPQTQIIFHALILSNVEYALPAIAVLLSETEK